MCYKNWIIYFTFMSELGATKKNLQKILLVVIDQLTFFYRN